MRLDIGDNSILPITVNVFNKSIPVDPCRSYLQVAIAEGQARLLVDYDAAPEGFSTDIEPVSLTSIVPATSQCPAPLPTGDG